jgi:hypothetical protein
MKRVLSEPIDKAKEAEEEKRLHLSETFRTADFHDLVDRTHVNVSHITSSSVVHLISVCIHSCILHVA